jgi:5-methylcytosine-specific restriction endonuclease McrA
MSKVCRRCGVERPASEFGRWTGSRDGLKPRCNACRRADYARNREQILREKADYYARNADSIRRKKAEYREELKSGVRSVVYVKPLEHRLMRIIANKMRDRGAPESHIFHVTMADARRLLAQPCSVCGTRDELTVDHIIPISRGGVHAIGNLQMLCAFHNRQKHQKVMTVWLYRGSLRYPPIRQRRSA